MLSREKWYGVAETVQTAVLESRELDWVLCCSIESLGSLSMSRFPGKWMGGKRRALRSKVRPWVFLVLGEGHDESTTKSV